MDQPTPTNRGKPIRHGDFDTLCDALDYAALCKTGFNFFDGRAKLKESLTYSELRIKALALAKRLVPFATKNSRIGLAAVSTPEFAIIFMACQYAGLVPAPLPLPVTLGGRNSYERQLQRLADTGDFHALFCPGSMKQIMGSALNDMAIPVISFEDLVTLPNGNKLRPFDKNDLCYIQYSSGSSSSPKGIIGTQASVSANCHAITKFGMEMDDNDRGTSWLPLYHDMGLIGFMLAPIMSQMTVDFIDPQDFTRRPITWLQLIYDHKGTFSFSPTFGYELCVRRWRNDRDLDLSSWKAAGIGGDMVRPEPLTEFSNLFSKMGFSEGTFKPSYGLAETTLAATFSPPGQGLLKHTIDMDRYERTSEAVEANEITNVEHKRTFVACGLVLPGHEVEIRDFEGNVLGGNKVGKICLRGPSVSPGYFRNTQATEASFSSDGWLDTGDLGYWLDNQLVVTGRFKDLILWHGRNIWPQDIEWAAQAAAPHRIGRACSFAMGGAGDQKDIMLLLECRTRDQKLLDEIYSSVMTAIRLEVGVPVRLQLVPKSTMVITSSGKLSRARVKAKFLKGEIIDIQADRPVAIIGNETA